MTDPTIIVMGDDAHDIERTIRLEPDPSVLRAIGRGHSLGSAIADIIDNSIDASVGAERVTIRFVVRNSEVIAIRIRDDGRGMGAEQLRHAMTLGKRRDYAEGALGHFGLGLKASSMSQARVLTVYSRTGDEPVQAMRMRREGLNPSGSDSATARARNIGGFEIEILTQNAAWHGFDGNGGDTGGLSSTGTVVEWQDLDGVSRAQLPSARRAWLNAVMSELRQELGLVFHRLITSQGLRIVIEEYDIDHATAGIPFLVEPIDPLDFRLAGMTGYPRTITAQLPSGAEVSATCHIIPPGAAHSQSARIFGRTRHEWQGLYIYRNDRLLQSGGWLSLAPDRQADLQLARVVVELTEGLLDDVTMNPEKRGVILRPNFMSAIDMARDDSGTTFQSFLEDARDVLKNSNVRQRGVKPVVDIGVGLPESVNDAVSAILGIRADAQPASISWKTLDEDRLFYLDHGRRTIWLNAGYRRGLTDGSPGGDAPLLKLVLFLLLESNFARGWLQQGTIDQVEAWQRVLAEAMFSQFDRSTYDPFNTEDIEATGAIDLFIHSETYPAAEDVADAPTTEDVAGLAATPRDIADRIQRGGRLFRVGETDAQKLTDDTSDESDASVAPLMSHAVDSHADFVGSGAAGEPRAMTADEGENHLTPVRRDEGTAADLEILELYRVNSSITLVAAQVGLEDREVAHRLCGLLLDLRGDIDNVLNAPRHGIHYTPDERERMVTAYKRGVPVTRIAADLGRTQLAVAWQLMDSPRRVVPVPRLLMKQLRRRLRQVPEGDSK